MDPRGIPDRDNRLVCASRLSCTLYASAQITKSAGTTYDARRSSMFHLMCAALAHLFSDDGHQGVDQPPASRRIHLEADPHLFA